MSRRLRYITTAFLAGSAFLLTSAAPPILATFGGEPAFAKGKGSGKGGGGKSRSKGKSGTDKGRGSSSRKSSSAPGQNKSVNPTGVAKASAGKPKAVIRQYVIENGLKQGDVASLAKSWNSLNRAEQAYVNNMDNPNSLPGLQIAYIRDNINAENALAGWEAVKGDLIEPPTEIQAVEAQDLVDQYNAWTAYQDALLADPDDPTLDGLLADFEALGGDPVAPPTEDQSTGALTLIDQFDTWTAYDDAKTAAADAFVSASVSYNSDAYDEATFGELKELVDDIISKRELDKLVSEFDAAAAEDLETIPPE